MHYRGKLEDTGKEFDASYNRGDPLSLKLGSGMVIKGWEEGLKDMCVGDERVLTIQPEWGYGTRAMGPIPANSVLGESSTISLLLLFAETRTAVFETKLMSIGKPPAKDEL